MSKTSIRYVASLLAVAALVVVTAGCWNPFAPSGGGDDDTPPVTVSYKERTSPANVVYNLNTAYADMNAREYLDCLAENFEFHLNPEDVNDPTNDPPLPEYWGKDEETRIHEAMFGEGSNVERITLTLTNLGEDYNPGADPVDPMDDRWTRVEGTDLRVTIPGDLTFLANADQEFIFQIDPNETGPSGERLYEIVRWEDKQRSGRMPVDEEAGELVSFGLIKALYR